jgi:hypothetical protein
MKRAKALITTVVFVGAIYVAYRLLPIYLANYQFQQELQSISREGAFANLNEDQIRGKIKEKIVSTEVPLRIEDVHIVRSTQDVAISAAYQVHVDFPIHPVDLVFTPAAHNGEKVEVPKPQPAP